MLMFINFNEYNKMESYLGLAYLQQLSLGFLIV